MRPTVPRMASAATNSRPAVRFLRCVGVMVISPVVMPASWPACLLVVYSGPVVITAGAYGLDSVVYVLAIRGNRGAHGAADSRAQRLTGFQVGHNGAHGRAGFLNIRA